jgi:DNA-binding HxlR family transcriptional regulator
MDQIRKICRQRKWAQDVLCALEHGPLRFSEIQQDITISSHQFLHGHSLDDTLTWLQEERLVVRHVNGSVISYQLTPFGADNVRLINQIRRLESTEQPDGGEMPR